MDVRELKALGRHVATREDEVIALAEGDEGLRQKLAQRAAQRSGRARSRRVARIGAAAAVLTIGIVLAWIRMAPRALTFTVGEPARPGVVSEWVSATRGERVPVLFSEGTRITLEPSARGRVVSVAPNGAEFVVESGKAAVSVVPDPNAEFRIRTGPFVVQVHGTRFTVEWDPSRDAFALSLYEGRVTVTGCSFGAGVAVLAGETVRASCAEPAPAPKPAAPSAPASEAPEPAASAHLLPPAPPAARAESWLRLARDGEYERAYRAATETGFDRELRARAGAEVVLLGDVARHVGRITEASSAYEAARERFPGTEPAANAAFALGRLAFDARKDLAGAARWFETYLDERPNGALAAAALGRLLEARIGLHETDRARSIAQRYLTLYPDGPLANEARKIQR